MSQDEQAAVEALVWVETADPVADAADAIAQGRNNLLTTGARGAGPAGIDPARATQLLEKCGAEPVPGGTDVVRGDTHLRYLQLARDYAEAYNRVIAEHCADQ